MHIYVWLDFFLNEMSLMKINRVDKLNKIMVEYIYIAIVDIKFKVKELKYFNFYSGIAIYKLLLPGTVYIW